MIRERVTLQSIKLSETWKARFKKVSQLRKHSPIPRQAINNYKEKMAFPA